MSSTASWSRRLARTEWRSALTPSCSPPSQTLGWLVRKDTQMRSSFCRRIGESGRRYASFGRLSSSVSRSKGGSSGADKVAVGATPRQNMALTGTVDDKGEAALADRRQFVRKGNKRATHDQPVQIRHAQHSLLRVLLAQTLSNCRCHAVELVRVLTRLKSVPGLPRRMVRFSFLFSPQEGKLGTPRDVQKTLSRVGEHREARTGADQPARARPRQDRLVKTRQQRGTREYARPCNTLCVDPLSSITRSAELGCRQKPAEEEEENASSASCHAHETEKVDAPRHSLLVRLGLTARSPLADPRSWDAKDEAMRSEGGRPGRQRTRRVEQEREGYSKAWASGSAREPSRPRRAAARGHRRESG